MSDEYITFEHDYDSFIDEIFMTAKLDFRGGSFGDFERHIFIKKDSIVNADEKLINVKLVEIDYGITEYRPESYNMKFEFINPQTEETEQIDITIDDFSRPMVSGQSFSYGTKNILRKYILKFNYGEVKSKIKHITIDSFNGIFRAINSNFSYSFSFCLSIKIEDLKYISSMEIRDRDLTKEFERYLSVTLYSFDTNERTTYLNNTIIYKDKIFIEAMYYTTNKMLIYIPQNNTDMSIDIEKTNKELDEQIEFDVGIDIKRT